MYVRFWGTRGSIPKPGPQTVRYGGNTPCVEVRTDSGVLIVLDCGSGAHALGHALLADPNAPRHGHVLITHTHWDHIQGLPFLGPLFDARFEWDIYGPRGFGPSIRETLAGQMQYSYSPITTGQFAAKVRYHDLLEGSFEIGDVRVSAHYLNHPGLALGYRIEADGATVVYATDHEPHSPALARSDQPPLSADERQYAAFVEAADLLIHDAQFTAADYDHYIGWGHSPVEFAVDLAVSGRVRQLALFHHGPMRDDDSVDALVELARRRVNGSGVDVFGAAEGMQIELQGAPAGRAPARVTANVELPPLSVSTDRVVLLAADLPAARSLAAAVQADGGRSLAVADAQALLRMAVQDKPSLIAVQRQFAGHDALELCRALREAVGQDLTDPAIIVVASNEQEIDIAAGVHAGVTDWLLWPFKETYARGRMQLWALRKACGWSPAPLQPGETGR
jgi:phosphoribosyl 1,2-cyclic phosphodiesterase